jgi:protein tyrosine phosphatase (PTP) superfamily phosphohydrolase (DUF442 family)
VVGRTRSGGPRRRRLGRRLGLTAGLLAALALWGLRRPLFEANFGVVAPGRVYRSAQPTEALDAWLGRYRIASVLNLRGGSPADAYYRDEVARTARRGVDFYDVPLASRRRPTRGELLRVLSVLDHCRYPLLIHCKQGADRTALASALYRLMRLGETPEQALGSFSLAHAHVPLFGPDRLHEPIEEYARWLSAQGRAHTPARFRDWLAHAYRDDDPPGLETPPVRPGPREARTARDIPPRR